MTSFFVANYALAADLENCDPPKLEFEASPQLAGIKVKDGPQPEPAWVDFLKSQVEEEILLAAERRQPEHRRQVAAHLALPIGTERVGGPVQLEQRVSADGDDRKHRNDTALEPEPRGAHLAQVQERDASKERPCADVVVGGQVAPGQR